MEEIVFEQSRKKILKLLIMSLIMTMLAIILFLFDNKQNIWKFAYIFAFLFFGTLALVYLTRLINRKPILKLTSKGIENNSTMFCIKFIPWESILNIEMLTISKIPNILVHIKNKKEFLENQSFFIKVFSNINILIGITPVMLNLSCAIDSEKDIFSSINKKIQ